VNDGHRRRGHACAQVRKHAYVAAMKERQADRLLDEAAREWAKAGMHRELETAAREAEAEAMARAAVAAAEEDRR
jgi:hypothetical protein